MRGHLPGQTALGCLKSWIESIKALDLFNSLPVRYVDVNLSEALQVAHDAGIYAYDAYLLVVPTTPPHIADPLAGCQCPLHHRIADPLAGWQSTSHSPKAVMP